MTGDLFDQVTYGLELPGTANHLRQLLMTPDVEAQEPAYSVGFSSGIGAEVSLPEQDKGISFRLIRCSRLVLVVNDGTRPIVVRGRHLQPGGVMPLTNGQVVLLPSGPLSFEDFAFFWIASVQASRMYAIFPWTEAPCKSAGCVPAPARCA